jgi:hypothetical protein
MGHFYRDIVRYVERMGPHEWFWVLAAMVIVGAICLRGYGSRLRR